MYRHRVQRPYHHVRYGFRHLYLHASGVRHPHRGRAQTRTRHRRQAAAAILAVVGLAVVGAFVARSALSSLDRARVPLEQARQLISQLQDDPQQLLSARGRAAAQRDIEAVQRDASSARAILESSWSCLIS